MGIGGLSIWKLLIILTVILLVFGTGRLRNLGSDLGGALKGFRKAMKDEEDAAGDEVPTGAAKEERAGGGTDPVRHSHARR